jgi:uncharacterized protein (UPF0335 family)
MTYAVSAEEFLHFLERFEALDAEKRERSDLQNLLMAELKGRGYDGRAFREVVRLRKMKPDDLAEFEAVVDLYRQPAGLA